MNAVEAMNALPAKIRNLDNDVYDERVKLDRMRLELKLAEADVALSVAAETDDAGKKRYTNAEARDAAAREYISRDPRATAARKVMDDQARTIQRMESTLQFLRDQLRNARIVLLARAPWDAVIDLGDVGATQPVGPAGATP